jgi:hypothetical protein
VLLALVPVALIAALVGPSVDTKPVLLVIFVLALVHAPVIPDVDAHSLHVIVQPFSLVATSIEPRIDTDARDLVLSPITCVHGSIVPLVTPDTVLASKSIITLVLRFIGPSFNTISMLQVVFPEALILRPIHVLVNASSIGFVVGPVPIVDVAIHMDESAFAVGPVFTPFATVFGPIGPGLLPEAITEPALPLARVHGSRLESVWGSLLSLLIRIVDVFGHSLSGLLLSEVLATSHLLRFQESDKLSSPVSSVPCLQLDDQLHIRHQKLVVVAAVIGGAPFGVEAAGSFFRAAIESLHLH